MYEENKKFSWTNFFIKGVIVIIFILFTVWLLSLSNKGISNKLDVLTDTIFSQNIEKMKQVGKDYFTTERLPQKVGEVKTLSLARMYDENYILEIKDKNGHACSAKNSYVSVEKMETEYQMKVYLECGEEADYIIVPMGCYNYCSTDICERRQEENTSTGMLEYEYKKTIGGNWTDWGNWSEWSKVSVTKTSYRDVETRVEYEEYSYDKTIYENEYVSLIVGCPSGYSKTSDGTKCYKVEKTNEYVSPESCAKTLDGFTLVSQNGFTCNYKKTYKPTTNPLACANSYDGFTLSNQIGFECKYIKTVRVPYTYTVTVPQTCYSQQITQSCSTCAPVVVNVPYDCSYSTTETGYRDETKTTSTTVGCPSGYTKSGNKCVSNTNKSETKQTTVGCPSGYNKTSDNTKCYKEVTKTKYANFVNSCPAGYNKTSDGSKCYKEVASTVTITGTREVTYYRYRLREYVGGTVDYKWSTSNNDTSLINAGYTLTGRTRQKSGK